ncbi:unnamed protein product [Urochloa decumbens]|uniref:Uncharacterized protein n=1 Tax=Urochloa decumbens TaxID=240449 RepID=A0ABC9FRE6_9POAL
MAIPSSTPEETPALLDIAIFPFLAKGHTIPLIHLAHYLHRHGLATVTFVTTPGNAAFVRDGLFGADAAVVELTFRADVSGIPPGVKSAEGLTSMASFAVFADATPLLRSQLEACFAEAQPPACLLITNPFLYWTNASGSRRGLVTSEEVSKVVRMLMLGEEGVEVAKNVAELSASAKEAMAEGGPFWKALKDMISELCVKKVNVNLQESQDDKVDA